MLPATLLIRFKFQGCHFESGMPPFFLNGGSLEITMTVSFSETNCEKEYVKVFIAFSKYLLHANLGCQFLFLADFI